jgi:uncharacterized RDD family membrane protein YckC
VHIELNFFHNWYSIVCLAIFSVGTPGKWLMKIRGVSLHHDHLSLWRCFERALGYDASALELGFGFV